MGPGKKGIELPFGWDTLVLITTVIVGGIFTYANFENKIQNLEEKMQEATAQIEELVSKHEISSEKRFQEMEEQVNWYQKELNLNPLSWRKKKK